MTDETPTFPEESKATAKDAPRSKRISNPRPKKTAKDSPVETPIVAEPVAEIPASPPPANDWPEPEPASTDAPQVSDHPKRKRRRKKGKGGGVQNQAPQTDGEPQIAVVNETPESPAPPRPNHPPRIKFDTEIVAKLAWKIYLSEVSEEGVALIGDGDAKDLARRCFRLSEIFMEEQFRRN